MSRPREDASASHPTGAVRPTRPSLKFQTDKGSYETNTSDVANADVGGVASVASRQPLTLKTMNEMHVASGTDNSVSQTSSNDRPQVDNTETQTPHTGTQTPHTETQTPHTGTQTPHTETQTPHTEPQTPHTETQTPHPETQTSHSETQTPHTGTQTPHTETQTPHTETQTPHTETQTPHTETRIPHPETQTPRPETRIPHPETQTPRPETQTPRTETQTTHTQTQSPRTKTQFPHTGTQTPHTETQTSHTQTETPHTQTQTTHTQTQSPRTKTQFPHTGTQTPHTQTQTSHTRSWPPQIQPRAIDSQSQPVMTTTSTTNTCISVEDRKADNVQEPDQDSSPDCVGDGQGMDAIPQQQEVPNSLESISDIHSQHYPQLGGEDSPFTFSGFLMQGLEWVDAQAQIQSMPQDHSMLVCTPQDTKPHSSSNTSTLSQAHFSRSTTPVQKSSHRIEQVVMTPEQATTEVGVRMDENTHHRTNTPVLVGGIGKGWVASSSSTRTLPGKPCPAIQVIPPTPKYVQLLGMSSFGVLNDTATVCDEQEAQLFDERLAQMGIQLQGREEGYGEAVKTTGDSSGSSMNMEQVVEQRDDIPHSPPAKLQEPIGASHENIESPLPTLLEHNMPLLPEQTDLHASVTPQRPQTKPSPINAQQDGTESNAACTTPKGSAEPDAKLSTGTSVVVDFMEVDNDTTEPIENITDLASGTTHSTSSDMRVDQGDTTQADTSQGLELATVPEGSSTVACRPQVERSTVRNPTTTTEPGVCIANRTGMGGPIDATAVSGDMGTARDVDQTAVSKAKSALVSEPSLDLDTERDGLQHNAAQKPSPSGESTEVREAADVAHDGTGLGQRARLSLGELATSDERLRSERAIFEKLVVDQAEAGRITMLKIAEERQTLQNELDRVHQETAKLGAEKKAFEEIVEGQAEAGRITMLKIEQIRAALKSELESVNESKRVLRQGEELLLENQRRLHADRGELETQRQDMERLREQLVLRQSALEERERCLSDARAIQDQKLKRVPEVSESDPSGQLRAEEKTDLTSTTGGTHTQPERGLLSLEKRETLLIAEKAILKHGMNMLGKEKERLRSMERSLTEEKNALKRQRITLAEKEAQLMSEEESRTQAEMSADLGPGVGVANEGIMGGDAGETVKAGLGSSVGATISADTSTGIRTSSEVENTDDITVDNGAHPMGTDQKGGAQEVEPPTGVSLRNTSTGKDELATDAHAVLPANAPDVGREETEMSASMDVDVVGNTPVKLTRRRSMRVSGEGTPEVSPSANRGVSTRRKTRKGNGNGNGNAASASCGSTPRKWGFSPKSAGAGIRNTSIQTPKALDTEGDSVDDRAAASAGEAPALSGGERQASRTERLSTTCAQSGSASAAGALSGDDDRPKQTVATGALESAERALDSAKARVCRRHKRKASQVDDTSDEPSAGTYFDVVDSEETGELEGQDHLDSRKDITDVSSAVVPTDVGGEKTEESEGEVMHHIDGITGSSSTVVRTDSGREKVEESTNERDADTCEEGPESRRQATPSASHGTTMSPTCGTSVGASVVSDGSERQTPPAVCRRSGEEIDSRVGDVTDFSGSGGGVEALESGEASHAGGSAVCDGADEIPVSEPDLVEDIGAKIAERGSMVDKNVVELDASGTAIADIGESIGQSDADIARAVPADGDGVDICGNERPESPTNQVNVAGATATTGTEEVAWSATERAESIGACGSVSTDLVVPDTRVTRGVKRTLEAMSTPESAALCSRVNESSGAEGDTEEATKKNKNANAKVPNTQDRQRMAATVGLDTDNKQAEGSGLEQAAIPDGVQEGPPGRSDNLPGNVSCGNENIAGGVLDATEEVTEQRDNSGETEHSTADMTAGTDAAHASHVAGSTTDGSTATAIAGLTSPTRELDDRDTAVPQCTHAQDAPGQRGDAFEASVSDLTDTAEAVVGRSGHAQDSMETGAAEETDMLVDTAMDGAEKVSVRVNNNGGKGENSIGKAEAMCEKVQRRSRRGLDKVDECTFASAHPGVSTRRRPSSKGKAKAKTPNKSHTEDGSKSKTPHAAGNAEDRPSRGTPIKVADIVKSLAGPCEDLPSVAREQPVYESSGGVDRVHERGTAEGDGAPSIVSDTASAERKVGATSSDDSRHAPTTTDREGAAESVGESITATAAVDTGLGDPSAEAIPGPVHSVKAEDRSHPHREGTAEESPATEADVSPVAGPGFNMGQDVMRGLDTLTGDSVPELGAGRTRPKRSTAHEVYIAAETEDRAAVAGIHKQSGDTKIGDEGVLRGPAREAASGPSMHSGADESSTSTSRDPTTSPSPTVSSAPIETDHAVVSGSIEDTTDSATTAGDRAQTSTTSHGTEDSTPSSVSATTGTPSSSATGKRKRRDSVLSVWMVDAPHSDEPSAKKPRIRFGQVEVRLYPRTLGGSCSVPDEGGCPIGLDWQYTWNEVNNKHYDNLAKYETYCKRSKRGKKFKGVVSEKERQAMLYGRAKNKQFTDLKDVEEYNNELDVIEALRESRNEVGCACAANGKCSGPKCLCRANGIGCHEGACGCTHELCQNPVYRYVYEQELIDSERKPHYTTRTRIKKQPYS